MTTGLKRIVLVNNTGTDIRGCVEDAVIRALKEATQLPEEIADLFVLRVVEVGGERRGILEFAQ